MKSGGSFGHARHRQTDEQRRHGDQEAGDRAGDADVEQHPLASGSAREFG